jgi:hypothetical protein
LFKNPSKWFIAVDALLQEPSVFEQSIPKQFASLSLIAGQILEEVYSSHQVRSSVYEGYLQQLDSWGKSLPTDLGAMLQTISSGPSTGILGEGLEGVGVSGIANSIMAIFTDRKGS